MGKSTRCKTLNSLSNRLWLTIVVWAIQNIGSTNTWNKTVNVK